MVLESLVFKEDGSLEGNSLREEVKDAICAYLEKEYHEERSAVYEEACDLSDVVFNVLGIPDIVQDAPYEAWESCKSATITAICRQASKKG